MKSDDYALVLGLRNSHDKRFPAGIVAGASVFVCDNFSFSGEVKFARKHTRYINRDLPQIVERAIGKLVDLWHDQDTRISAYKEAEVDDARSPRSPHSRHGCGRVLQLGYIPAVLQRMAGAEASGVPAAYRVEPLQLLHRGAEGDNLRRAAQEDGGAARPAGCAGRAGIEIQHELRLVKRTHRRLGSREKRDDLPFGWIGTLFFSCRLADRLIDCRLRL